MADDRKFVAYAAKEAKAPFEDWEYTPIPLKPDEVEIQIDACGVCHSDLHQQNNDWGICKYPLVAGHEIIGKIVELGAGVKGLTKGSRVGVGPQTGHCGECRECKRGAEQHCPKKIKSYNSATGNSVQPYTYGGFSHHIRVRADWAIPIPDELTTAEAAPLLCAGVTTWTPFVHYNVKKGDKVGILGMGGLGHVGLQFAVKLGCDVTCFSTSPAKEEEARKFGAHHFVNVKDKEQMAEGVGKYDFLLSTISATICWDPYLALLRPDGAMAMVGLPAKVSFNPMKLVANRLKVGGSYLASNQGIKDMLAFCAQHGVKAQVETLPMTAENINVALHKIETNDVRYRAVLLSQDFIESGEAAADEKHEDKRRKK